MLPLLYLSDHIEVQSYCHWVYQEILKCGHKEAEEDSERCQKQNYPTDNDCSLFRTRHWYLNHLQHSVNKERYNHYVECNDKKPDQNYQLFLKFSDLWS
jgi:hypothetical protein